MRKYIINIFGKLVGKMALRQATQNHQAAPAPHPELRRPSLLTSFAPDPANLHPIQRGRLPGSCTPRCCLAPGYATRTDEQDEASIEQIERAEALLRSLDPQMGDACPRQSIQLQGLEQLNPVLRWCGHLF